jgi:hypothetical protein
MHPCMCEASAKDAAECCTDLFVCCIRVRVQRGFRGKHDAAQAKATLGGSLIDEGLLEGMGSFRGAQSVKGKDGPVFDGAYRLHAGAHRLTVDQNRARPALGHSAPETWTSQLELIRQHPKQRCFRFYVYESFRAVDLEVKDAHPVQGTSILFFTRRGDYG